MICIKIFRRFIWVKIQMQILCKNHLSWTVALIWWIKQVWFLAYPILTPEWSSTNSAWWCADARTALLHSIWQHTGHRSLRLRHDSISISLPAVNWQFRHIDGSHMVVGRSLYRRSVDVELTAETFTRPFYGTFWTSSQNISLLWILVYAAH